MENNVVDPGGGGRSHQGVLGPEWLFTFAGKAFFNYNFIGPSLLPQGIHAFGTLLRLTTPNPICMYDVSYLLIFSHKVFCLQSETNLYPTSIICGKFGLSGVLLLKFPTNFKEILGSIRKKRGSCHRPPFPLPA